MAFILGDKILSEEWKASIKAIAARLKQMRTYLREELERLGAPGSWVHITNQVGLFCFIGTQTPGKSAGFSGKQCCFRPQRDASGVFEEPVPHLHVEQWQAQCERYKHG